MQAFQTLQTLQSRIRIIFYAIITILFITYGTVYVNDIVEYIFFIIIPSIVLYIAAIYIDHFFQKKINYNSEKYKKVNRICPDCIKNKNEYTIIVCKDCHFINKYLL